MAVLRRAWSISETWTVVAACVTASVSPGSFGRSVTAVLGRTGTDSQTTRAISAADFVVS